MKRRENMLILIPSFILVLLWIIFSIYHNLSSSTISEALNLQISPIAPAFDLDTVENLKRREQIIPASNALPETPTPTPSISETIPSSSESATISTQTEEATAGGEIQ